MKVISFSLFGDHPKYLVGAERNVALSREIYPGWGVRVYVDETVPPEVVVRLRDAGAEVVDMTGADLPCKRLWRYLVHDDDGVEAWIARDVDSRLGTREKGAVDEWLASPRKAHVMRDHPRHRYQIMAGMFGLKGRVVPSMREAIQAAAPGDGADCDQQFLGRSILPLIRDDVMIHDEVCDLSLYCVGARPFPSPRTDGAFVGEVFDENDEPNEGHRELLRAWHGAGRRNPFVKAKRWVLGASKRTAAGEAVLRFLRRARARGR